jgi:lactate dehydrogenase-like 2-hydroxyacid dehydrogenase
VARILLSTPLLPEPLSPLTQAGHELVEGEPGSDAGADALMVAPTQPVDAAAIGRMPALRAIAVAGAGADAVDADAAAAREIAVLTAGEALVETTADLAFGLIIAASRLFSEADRGLRAGDWGGWSFLGEGLARDVHGAVLGLVGYGRIARAVAARARGFAMTVRHHQRTPSGEEGFVTDLDELLATSDIVSLHVPLSASTRGLIDRRRIALMKQTSVLVNTARGAVLDEEALAEALVAGRLFAAGLDVYVHEPHVHPRLLAAPRTVLLPHLGSATLATREAMLRLAAEKLAAFLR